MMNYVPNLKYKTSVCENWLQNGNCHKGQTCHFAHGENELRSIADNQKTISEQNSFIKVITEQTNYPSNYKTIKCKFYDKGLCQLGNSCTFVHDSSERRPKPQVQNYWNYYPQWPNYPIQTNQQYNGLQTATEMKETKVDGSQDEKVEEQKEKLKSSGETQNSPIKDKGQNKNSEGGGN